MKNIIRSRLNNISDLNERKLLKKILEDLYENLLDYNMDMYVNLEKRIYDEIDDPLDKFYIYSSLVDIVDLDPISSFFHTMDVSESEKQEILFDMDGIANTLEQGNEVILTTIFLKCNYLTFKEILDSKRVFSGFIKTDKDIYEINAVLKQNFKYIHIIENLYHIFQLNHIEWKTVNCAYAYKFADIVLSSPIAFSKGEQITEITIDLGEYEEYKIINVVPVWNIKEINVQDKSFPMPAKDRIHYEHVIAIPEAERENGYMLTYNNASFEYAKRYENDMVIIAFSENQNDWNIIQVENNKKNRAKSEYQILSNNRNLSFAGRFASMKSIVIHTKGELARILEMYELKNELQFRDIEVVSRYKKQIQTIDFNSFIDDNIRVDNDKKFLVLKFYAFNKDDYLIYDKMSFLVSDIQLLFPEYRCIGELI